ncbi:MAG: hypothetical protein IPM50_02730 [Acidobacteriota bacterium]|nr:MAG: hypothetical protein IPM50_02730 [Acidobacteriota bacterium]
MERKNSIGERLLQAFGTNDKEFIAKTLGFSSVQGVYKVLNGSRELDYAKLAKYRDYTKCSIDWLLTGEGEMSTGPKVFDLEYSINKHDNWLDVLNEWYEFEGEEMPETMGASFMGGWKSFDKKQKIEAITDFKRFLDRIKDD